jgi:hypothetical protein
VTWPVRDGDGADASASHTAGLGPQGSGRRGHQATIEAAALQPDPDDPAKTALVAAGATGGDVVKHSHHRSGGVKVVVNKEVLEVFAPTRKLIAFGQEGDDRGVDQITRARANDLAGERPARHDGDLRVRRTRVAEFTRADTPESPRARAIKWSAAGREGIPASFGEEGFTKPALPEFEIEDEAALPAALV